MSNTSSENILSCANCGKGEEEISNLKTCTACKLVKYCSRECQIAHRPQHKKDCKRRAAELHDEKLFKQPPPLEDCPICMVRLPSLPLGRTYMSCCGKVICSGCVYAYLSTKAGRQKKDYKCPFCRTPPSCSVAERHERYKKRVDLNDPTGMRELGCMHLEGEGGWPQNYEKALELLHRAAELGNASAYYDIGICYSSGQGVERNDKKARHYFELAAINGEVEARYNLSIIEGKAGNVDRLLKHSMIAVKGGHSASLRKMKELFSFGVVAKDDYTKALRSYQAYIAEIKSDQRDEAVAFRGDDHRYYESSLLD